ncbi:MAG: dienelactone hydrolase family protein, partial [Planctomycetes bacterium]|nr:dienelactone hydrolase family protein [Planctomycetota bacterium]
SLIAYIHREYSHAEISVGGFSQGASMSSMLADSATPINHLILFSPGLFLEEVVKPPSTAPVVYISHGRQDDILLFSNAQKLKLLLSNAGYEVKFTAFEGGHTIPAVALDEAKHLLDGDE